MAFIGAGRMAEALISGVLNAGLLRPSEIAAADADSGRLGDVSGRYGVATAAGNPEAVASARYVVLAVKPQHLDEVLAEIRPALGGEHVIISIAAGVPIDRIRSLTGGVIPVVRVMPNAAAMAGQGMAAICIPEGLDPKDARFAMDVFLSVGKAVRVDEDQIDKVTAVSGSGPAYFFALTKWLTEAGVAVGLPRSLSEELSRQTMVGAAEMLKVSDDSPDGLVGVVASPGGTTEAALNVLENLATGGAIRQAVEAAVARAAELGRKS